MRILMILTLLFFSCIKDNTTKQPTPTAYKITKSVTYNNVNVDVVKNLISWLFTQ